MSTKPVILGDPHLGRRFTKGVPVERRGQREQLVREDFVRRLDPKGASTHICLGDLFDKPQVDYDTLLFAAQAYMAAAYANPRTIFYLLQGNHDDSRDLAEVTAWDVFGQLVRGVQNVRCVIEPVAVAGVGLLLPWHPTKSASDQLEVAANMAGAFNRMGISVGITTAYGHWDVDPRSPSHNLIPTKELAALGITKAYTGHVHLPSTFKRDGVEVEVVGSMQPYAQGEDGGQCAGSVQYRTFCINGLEDLLVDDPQALSNVCVRLQLQPGEQFEGEVPDCLSFDIQRVRPVEEEPAGEVSLDGFDTTAAARAALDEHDIIPEVRDQIDQRWRETFGAEG